MKITPEKIMEARFGKDSLIALATVQNGVPWVRTINAVYIEGSFYSITYARSEKIRQIQQNPVTAVCGEWFSGHGIGENMGHVLEKENREILEKLRIMFADWYDNGHIREEDPNTVLLRIRLTDGILFADGQRYELRWCV